MRSLWLIALFLFSMLGSSSATAQEMTRGDPEIRVIEGPPVVPDDWQALETPWLTMYGPDYELQAMMHLADVGNEALPELAAELGVPIGGTVHVVVAPTRGQFMNMQPGPVPEYADGTAWPSRGHIYLQRPAIRSSERPIEQVLRHELVHILLGRTFAPATPPTWLQEGTATLLSGEYDGDMSMLLVQAVATGHRPSLSAISNGFPRHQPRAQLAYAESADFLVFLRENYGDDAISKLVLAGKQGAPFPAAVRSVTGEFLEDVERDWRRRFHTGALSWFTLLSNWEMWWAAGGLFAMVGLVLARRRSNARLTAMAAEEARLDRLMAELFQRDEVG
ncbi:MAG: hypothetical protein ACJATT_004456 [Myxococcota bacterium]|jgi:hypothetical protein